MKKKIKIQGMTCASCSNLIQNSLSSDEKKYKISVNLATESASLDGDFDLQKIEKEIEGLGFKVIKKNEEDGEKEENLEKIFLIKFILSLILTIPVGATMFLEIPKNLEIFFVIFASINVFIIGINFHTSFLKKLLKMQFNMDSLISIGTLTAIIYSLYGFLNGQFFGHFLEGASFIITFILLGKFLEIKTKKNAGNALKKLFSLQEKFANLVNGEKIEIEKIRIGDEILVKAGEKIPVDGKIFDGNSEIDESMISGESVPKFKNIGEKVFSGTINLTGILKIKVEKEIGETFLSKIVEAVENAQNQKAPIQKLADKISGIFVPVIILFAISSFIFWFNFGKTFDEALLVAVSILVVACPCALGLATPMALITAGGEGAKKGILIKNAEALEKSKKITAMVFDKTGTLTEGKPELKAFKIFSGDEEKMKKIIYFFTKLSNHPFSAGIKKFFGDEKNFLGDKNIFGEIKNFKEISGKGISGEFEGKKIFLGSKKILEDEKKFLEDEKNFSENKNIFEKTFLEKNLKNGETPIYFFLDGEIIGIFLMADKIKNGAQKLIENLQKQNIKTFLLTGDNKKTAEIVGKELGIEKIFSEVLPKDKFEKIKEIQQSGENVGFVGDGINDAIALTQSDLAIAMGNGSEVASESADIVILNGEPEKIFQAINLSKFTNKIIKQNLFWAFFYNILMIPLAFFGIFKPMFASFAMSFSSVSVVLNSLRIKKFNK